MSAKLSGARRRIGIPASPWVITAALAVPLALAASTPAFPSTIEIKSPADPGATLRAQLGTTASCEETCADIHTPCINRATARFKQCVKTCPQCGCMDSAVMEFALCDGHFNTCLDGCPR